MPDQEPEEQSWPPSPAGQAPPSVATPTGLPRGLKIGLAAAATGIVFTLWHLFASIRIGPHCSAPCRTCLLTWSL